MSGGVASAAARGGTPEVGWWRDRWLVGIGAGATLSASLVPTTPTGAGLTALFTGVALLAWLRVRFTSVVITPDEVVRRGMLRTVRLRAADVRRAVIVEDELRAGEIVVVGPRLHSVAVGPPAELTTSAREALRSFLAEAAAHGGSVDADVLAAVTPRLVRR